MEYWNGRGKHLDKPTMIDWGALDAVQLVDAAIIGNVSNKVEDIVIVVFGTALLHGEGL